MDQVMKAIWIDNLRSGKFQQITGSLMHRDPSDGLIEGFCCLGVLCYQQDSTFDGEFPDDNICTAQIGDYAKGLSPSKADELAGLNDAGLTFAEIADVIERFEDRTDKEFEDECQRLKFEKNPLLYPEKGKIGVTV